MTIDNISHFNLSFKIIILYLLFKIISVTYGFNNISFLKSGAIDIAIFITFLILYVDYNKMSDISIGFKSYISFFLLLTFFFVCYSSFIKHPADSLNIKTILKVIEYVIQFIVFFFIFGNILYKSDLLFENFGKYILYFAVFSSVFSLINYETQILYNKGYYYSTVGFFFHPNTTAFLYTFSFPILFYKYLSKQINVINFILMNVLFIPTLLFTFSRAGYISVSICILIITFVKSKKLFFFFLVLFVLIFITIAINLVAPKSVSTVSRLQLILTAVALLSSKNNYLWGLGIDSYSKMFYDQKTLFGNYEPNVNSPHNFILLLLLQFGVFTLISYLLFIFSILKNTLGKLRDIADNDRRMRIILSLTIILGVIIQNIFEEVFVRPDFPIMATSLIFMGYLYAFILHEKSMVLKNKLKYF